MVSAAVLLVGEFFVGPSPAPQSVAQSAGALESLAALASADIDPHTRLLAREGLQFLQDYPAMPPDGRRHHGGAPEDLGVTKHQVQRVQTSEGRSAHAGLIGSRKGSVPR